MKNTLDLYTKFLSSHMYRLKDQSKISKKKAPFITISRQTGAGGITLGKKLVDLLGETGKEKHPWLLLDRDLVEKILKSKGMPKEYLAYMKEEKVSEIKDVFETIFKLHPPAFALVKKVSEAILHLAQVGHVVIVGRGGNVLTREIENGVHIRLVGSLEKRIQRVMAFYKMTETEAKEKIKKEDKGRKDYLKQNFNQDINNPLLYDLVMNTDELDIAKTAEVVIKFLAIKKKEN